MCGGTSNPFGIAVRIAISTSVSGSPACDTRSEEFKKIDGFMLHRLPKLGRCRLSLCVSAWPLTRTGTTTKVDYKPSAQRHALTTLNYTGAAGA